MKCSDNDYPALMRLDAMGAPMIPSPRNPTFPWNSTPPPPAKAANHNTNNRIASGEQGALHDPAMAPTQSIVAVAVRVRGTCLVGSRDRGGKESAHLVGSPRTRMRRPHPRGTRRGVGTAHEREGAALAQPWRRGTRPQPWRMADGGCWPGLLLLWVVALWDVARGISHVRLPVVHSASGLARVGWPGLGPAC